MGEPDPVAFDDDDALPLCGFEELDQPVMVDCGRLADQLDRRLGQACSGKQHVVYLGLEAADPRPHQVSECLGQHLIDALDQCARQFDGVERVSGRYLVNSRHCCTRYRPSQLVPHNGVKRASTAAVVRDWGGWACLRW